MEVPATSVVLIISAFALLPGIPADRVYRAFIGYDWREDKWHATLRLLGFSLAGVAIYAAVAPSAGLPPPSYVVPAWLATITPTSLGGLAVALLGHMICGVLAAAIAIVTVKLAASMVEITEYSSAWDHFINRSVGKRWVVVTMKSGDAYAGYVEVVDTSVKPEERDLVLHEPAKYDAAANQYIVAEYSSMFLLGSNIASMAAVADPAVDTRIMPPGTALFTRKSDE